MKANKTLVMFCIAYNLFTIDYVWNVEHDPSATLAYVYIFPIFWLMAGLTLRILFRMKKAAIKNAWDKGLLFLSTPLPLLIGFFIAAHWPSNRLLTSSYEYNYNGRRHRKMQYEYSIGHQQRVEYYISKDSVTDSIPYPKINAWLKDSVWIYYKKDGTIEKHEDYRKNNS